MKSQNIILFFLLLTFFFPNCLTAQDIEVHKMLGKSVKEVVKNMEILSTRIIVILLWFVCFIKII